VAAAAPAPVPQRTAVTQFLSEADLIPPDAPPPLPPPVPGTTGKVPAAAGPHEDKKDDVG
jgi:hypothetical protein